MGQGLQGDAGLEGDANAGEIAETVEKVGVEGDAEVGEGVELGRIVGIADGQHSGRGGGGFGEWGGSIKYCDMKAPAIQFEGEGETDDACSGDADVWVMHGISLVRHGEVIV